MANENGSGSIPNMDSSFESNSNTSLFGFSDVSSADINLTTPCDPSDEDVFEKSSTNEATVEDDIKQVGEQLTENLMSTEVSSESLVVAARRRVEVSLWLKSMLPSLNIGTEPSEEDLRECWRNGVVLCNIMNKLSPNSVPKIVEASETVRPESARQQSENIKNFLQAVDELRLPTFEASDLEHGSMADVVDCLLSLKEYYEWKYGAQGHTPWKQVDYSCTSDEVNAFGERNPCVTTQAGTLKSGNQPRKRWIIPDLENCAASDSRIGQETTVQYGQRVGILPGKLAHCRMNNGLDTKFDAESLLSIPILPDSTSIWMHEVVQKFQKILQEKGMWPEHLCVVGSSGALSNFNNAPSQQHLRLTNSIFGEKQSEEVSILVEFMLRKVMEEYEHRIQTQGEHMKKLKHALREVLAREDKLMSRAKVLEALAAGTGEEIKLVTAQLKKMKKCLPKVWWWQLDDGLRFHCG